MEKNKIVKKYELIELTEQDLSIDSVKSLTESGKTLYRIKALRDFSDVKAGDWGGYVESEYNLSQEGNCWIFWHAKVWGNIQITGDSIICGRSNIFT